MAEKTRGMGRGLSAILSAAPRDESEELRTVPIRHAPALQDDAEDGAVAGLGSAGVCLQRVVVTEQRGERESTAPQGGAQCPERVGPAVLGEEELAPEGAVEAFVGGEVGGVTADDGEAIVQPQVGRPARGLGGQVGAQLDPDGGDRGRGAQRGQDAAGHAAPELEEVAAGDEIRTLGVRLDVGPERGDQTGGVRVG